MPVRPTPPDGATLDELSALLQDLRTHAGLPSYADIALRIARQREARGVPRDEARVGRTTVYDAFRTGRRRIDADLVVEIVRALGASDEEAARWATVCRQAMRSEPPPRTPDPVVEPAAEPGHVSWRPTVRLLLWLLPAAVVLNLLGRVLVNELELSLHLDMSGTAISAVVLGPWWGALVGASTNLIGTADGLGGPLSAWFAPVNVAGALIWGYGIRRFGMGRTLPRFFVLNLVTALGCSALAIPIAMHKEIATIQHGSTQVAITMLEAGVPLLLAYAIANVLMNVADKVISGFVALTFVEAMPLAVRVPIKETLGLLEAPDRESHTTP